MGIIICGFDFLADELEWFLGHKKHSASFQRSPVDFNSIRSDHAIFWY